MTYKIKYLKEGDGTEETYENVSILRRWRSVETGNKGFLVSIPERKTTLDAGVRKFLSSNILQIS